jgi:TolB-like protein/DNA-binding winged helix-turn-helix (wHTH) protein
VEVEVVEAPASSSRRVRTGLFEIDLGSGEVHKEGRKVPLQEQPFRVVAILLERPGEVVTREELHARLWPADTYVGFDEGLNTAVRKLRVAFGDSAVNPRFIETIPRHGYRFIGPVEPEHIPSPAPRAEANPYDSLKRQFRLPMLTAFAVMVVAAALVGLNVRSWRDRLLAWEPKTQIQALAVLPLVNLSGDLEQEYFADGMTEALIIELSKVSRPRVISRQSIMQYKGSKKPLREIARELNVDAVLEGTVEHSGSRVRLVVRLNQVSPEGQLWANQYNRDIHDLRGLQDEIAHAVTDEIRVNLRPQERVRLANSRPVDPEAQDDYFRGRFFWNHGTTGALSRDQTELELGLQTAIGYFKRAIEKDPDYALAYAGLADAYIALGEHHEGGHYPKETLPEAKAAATKASELDPSLGEAHFSLAQTIELYDWNWSGAEKEYRLALELNPNYADAHLEYGRFLQAVGRNDEATAQMNYAIKLDPLNFKTMDVVGYVTYASGQYDLAIEQFSSLGDDFGLGWAYREKKMYPHRRSREECKSIGAAQPSPCESGRRLRTRREEGPGAQADR